ncbi:PAS domain S-box protein [Sphingomonas sp. BGYR3]|uniref:PAS domain S-box protein n=1 Tax=Sphingomonas sp. BGYR3 TaxID=2975483 RepID=UPI0021A3BE64|nr:PAS domain S-box protein [Sphingomonas sp. BGYR3]MDG5488525.1 PAS domain S-box protein [Sphingomonas sp. BGYR3]
MKPWISDRGSDDAGDARALNSHVARALRILAVALGFGFLAWVNITMTREGTRVAALWLSNALLVAAILRDRPRAAPLYILASFAANVAANTLTGDTPGHSLTLALVNAVEVTILFLLIGRIAPDGLRMDALPDLGRLLAAVVAATTASSSLATIILLPDGASLSWTVWSTWFMADALGLMLLTPLILIAADAVRHPAKAAILMTPGGIAVLLGTIGVTAIVFTQATYPFLFLVCPMVLYAAFRTGMVGTAVAIAFVSLISSAATLAGWGPIALLVHGGSTEQLFALQLFLAVNFAMGLPVAALLRGREAMADQLAESRNFAASILTNMSDVVFRTDAEGRWIFLNPAWEVLTGYTVAESMGWYTTRLLHPDDYAAALALYPRVDAGEIEEARLRQRFTDKAGALRHIEVTIRRLANDDGSFAGVTGNIRDVTEAHLALTALSESEKRFQTLAVLSPAGIFRTGRDGHSNYVNPAWLQMSGVTEEQALSGNVVDAMHPDDRQRIIDGWLSTVAAEREFREEMRWIHTDGSVRWVDLLAAPERDANGTLIGFIGVTVDITDRKEMAKVLADRERQLSLLATHTTDAIFRIGLDGICRYASPATSDLLGLPSEGLVGYNMLDRFHPDDDVRARAAFAALVSGTTDRCVVAYRTQLVHGMRDYLWVEASCRLVRSEQTGEPEEVVASIRDISARKALEFDLEEARQRAEQAAAVKAMFLANMSHEIRTPMNGVLGFADLLLASDLDTDQRRQVEMIVDSGGSMMRLLNDILDLSKIEAGRLQARPEPLDPAALTRSVAALFEPVAQGKGVAVAVSVAPDVPVRIQSDPLRMRQILVNLTGNAVKFTQQGQVSLSVSVLADPGGDRLAIAVRDTGIGIPADQHERVFAAFAQADAGALRQHGGTGLGLAISAQLADLLGGAITLDSRPGEGACFTLTLPLVLAPPDAAVALPPPPDAPLPRTPPPRPAAGATLPPDAPRVLIAEDHDINRALMADIAVHAGLDADFAHDGEQAVAMVARAAMAGAPYALVLMDVQMPVMDGLAATRRLRQAGFDADRLPIVALTANAFADDVERCLDAGMQAHLAKPVTAAAISAVVARMTRGDAPAGPVSGARAGDDPLAARYAQRRAEAVAMARGVADGSGDGARLADLLHQLAGVAGRFDDAPLGDAARLAERRLRDAPGDAAAIAADWLIHA